MTPAADQTPLTVAVTGPTGTFGQALVPLLQADDRIGRIVGVARRPFDPAERGWTKMTYRRGDVRDRATLDEAFEGVDVVVHLAFQITGNAPADEVREINVDGTMRTLASAAGQGARRFVYASSVAAYGFHRDNPIGMTEDWPTRPADHFSYAQEKAELEARLAQDAPRHRSLDLYVLRPPVVLGPHMVGAKEWLPAALAPLGHAAGAVVGRIPLPLPVPVPLVVPDLPIQLVHEDDVAAAFVACVVGSGPPGAYNIASDVTSLPEVARVLGFAPVAVSADALQPLARLVAAAPTVPSFPPLLEWTEALSRPAIVDAARARRELGWRPRYTSLDAVRSIISS